MSELLNLLAIIVIFGVILGLVNGFLPMPPAIKSLLNLVVFVVLLIYVLQFFNLIAVILPILHIFK